MTDSPGSEAMKGRVVPTRNRDSRADRRERYRRRHVGIAELKMSPLSFRHDY